MLPQPQATGTELPAPADTPQAAPRRGLWGLGCVLAELLAAFATGVMVMSFIHVDPRGVPADQVGVAGFDGFYHTKMAAMMPEVGLVTDFPWLREVYFSQLDSGFISHHYGFHVLLLPFVQLSHWWNGDYLTGGRWAIATCFGVVLALMQALLVHHRVRWRWLWLVAFLLLPSEFFGRHAFVRAICPSLMFMLALMLLMFRERYVLAGVVVWGYVHLYLGSVVYAPLIVGTYVACSLIGHRDDRRVLWRLVLWTSCGWLLGLRTYPYFDGALEFLRMQILGTGLDPDIEVGSEWNSYGSVWHFAVQMCGPLLAIWVASFVLRARMGKRLSAQEMTLAVLNFVFLFLTFKAKRFIEYWPPLCLLSAAYMAAPILSTLTARLDPTGTRARSARGALIPFGAALTACVAILAALYSWKPQGIERFMIEWQTWTMLSAALLLPMLACIWCRGADDSNSTRQTAMRALAVVLYGAIFAMIVTTLGKYALQRPDRGAPRLAAGVMPWVVLVGVYAFFAYRTRNAGDASPRWTLSARLLGTSTVMCTGVAVAALVVLLAAGRLVALQRDVYCGYNLPAIRDAMQYLKDVSDPGDVVFTDDWDVFPVYFYHNTHNNYLVGLDPKFTHHRDPELWERYVKITRGLTPRTFQARWTRSDGVDEQKEITARIEDIRDHFGADYVIVDGDHTPLAKKLAQAPDFAELIYPKSSYEECANEPYVIFKVRGGEHQHDAAPGGIEPAPLFLSDATPLSVSQGWGDLTRDRSVSDQPIHLGDRFYTRGIGTHAPHELVYEIPTGYDTFVATVGVNRSTQERGSVIVSIELDGREVYRSSLLSGASKPVAVRLGTQDAKRLTLRASATADGNRWDHVDWAMARLLPSR